jgi:hypothetical protein
MFQLAFKVGYMNQRLGRYAPAIEANPTQQFSFHKGHFQPKLSGPDRGNITTRACAYYRHLSPLREIAYYHFGPSQG